MFTTTPININYYYYLSNRNTNGAATYRTTQLNTEYIGNTAYRYLYDNVGNITAIQEGTRKETEEGLETEGRVTKVTYTYDALNQLTRENNRYLNQTIVYNYDNGGNITSKVIYPYTTQADLTGVTPTETITYQYTDSEWKDLLTSYDGEAITYDAIGNPLTYRGYTLDWTGRELISLTDSTKNITYTYDAEGLRATKTVNGVKTEYQYVGNQLVYEKRGDMPIYYMYDVAGNLSGIRYILNGVQMDYYAVCNSRGDVEAFYNGAGALRARYIYDSWGNVISIVDANGNEITDQNNVAHINPIRYRGYYYDTDTGLYYLQSRYYDAEVGRFVSADASEMLFEDDESLLQYNLFVYCWNNPVIMVDSDGYSTLVAGSTFFIAAGSVGAANSWNPVGWAIVGALVVVIGGYYIYDSVKTAKKSDPDPYARPGQKKQGRERKAKARKKDNWKPKSNPKKPKKHTPGKDHRKYKPK